MMISVVPFEAEHLIDIIKRNRKEGYEPEVYTPEQTITAFTSPGSVAYTIMLLSAPIACAGIVNFGFKRGEAWLVVSDLFHRYRLAVLRILKREMVAKAKEGSFRRVQATSFTEELDRYFRFLEFKREGILKAYGPRNENIIIYGRVFKGV